MNYRNPELRKRLADEYVLGTLHGAARARFERLMYDDASLRALVDKSASQWSQLTELVPQVKPPQHVWENIQQRTKPHIVSQTKPSASGSIFSALGLNFWRAWAVVATVTAIFFGVSTMQWQANPITGSAANYFVLITDDAKSQASWIIGADQKTQIMSVKALSPQPLPEDRVFQLWVKVKNETAVRSVGLIPASGEATLSISAAINAILSNVEKFGVSVEPLGGSPTGQPTTTPLYHGKVLAL
ncbi:MAG: anti-sigma factor [Cellvibrionaceae bacterium]